jgi:AcrR family transcriptional regulator
MPVTRVSQPDAQEGHKKTSAERSRAATRARLLASARTLFAARGLHKVTTHDIAADAGVAAGTFYLHFSDKREIFREIAEATLSELKARLDDASDGVTERETEVRAQALALTDFALENRDVIRILFSADDDAAAVESDLLEEFALWIEEGRREDIVAGEMPAEIDPTLLSHAIVGMWARVLKWWLENPERVSRDELVETLCRIQLSGTHPA